MSEPREYYHLRAWCEMMGSYEYFIVNQQSQAAVTNAPINAIYGDHGKWSTADQIRDQETRDRINERAAQLKKEASNG